ncbi:hypothetical protein L1887_19165 [Cichorium endivia]|nr:hypothetical protein L1887_19165 [Cichorium endivia]
MCILGKCCLLLNRKPQLINDDNDLFVNVGNEFDVQKPSVVSPVIRDDGGGEEDGMLKSQIEKEKDFEVEEPLKDTDVEVERDTLEAQTGTVQVLSEDNYVPVINVEGNYANGSEEIGGLISSCGPEHLMGFSDEVEPNGNRSSDYVNSMEMEPNGNIPDLNDLFQVGPDLIESSRDGSDLKDSIRSGSPCLRHSSKASGRRRNSRMSLKFKDVLKESAMTSRKSLGGSRSKVMSVGSNSSSPVSSANSTTVEIAKTIEVGSSIGFHMRGSEEVIRAVIEGEGVKIYNQ